MFVCRMPLCVLYEEAVDSARMSTHGAPVQLYLLTQAPRKHLGRLSDRYRDSVIPDVGIVSTPLDEPKPSNTS